MYMISRLNVEGTCVSDTVDSPTPRHTTMMANTTFRDALFPKKIASASNT